jgi:2,3-bisphosphoglycerate-independent phosphoglycerate mutase
VKVDGAEVFFRHEREHRVLLVLRGDGLDPRVAETDPQRTGVAPNPPEALEPHAERTAELLTGVTSQVRTLLADEPRANFVLLRGFDTHRDLPGYDDRFGLRAAAVAIYPMYRGIARLLGMDVIGEPADLDDQIEILRNAWREYDYFFLHHKYTDSAGEDGDRVRKIAAIERFDEVVPALRELEPDVIAVTGDHSTPSQMAGHSWHPVPVLVWSERCGRDEVERFGERWCLRGALGTRPSKDLMAIILANAGRLQKYGA